MPRRGKQALETRVSMKRKVSRDVKQISAEIQAVSQEMLGGSGSDRTRREKVLEVLSKHPEGLTAEVLSEMTGSALNGLYLVLRSMEVQGKIIRTGTRPRVYKVAENTVTSAVQHLKFLSGTLNTLAVRLASVCEVLNPPKEDNHKQSAPA